MRYALAILIAMFGLGLAEARADQTDPRLKDLFEQLHAASSPEAASTIESEIWVIWEPSGAR